MSLIITIPIIIISTNQKKTKSAPNPIKGIIFSIIYMLLVALSTYFEKDIYINNITVFDLYYYKSIIYFLTSLFFAINILITPTKLKNINIDIIKGCGLTPIGNVLYSFALNTGSIILVAPISSLYSILTNIFSRIVLKEKINLKEKICIYLILILTILLIIFEI